MPETRSYATTVRLRPSEINLIREAAAHRGENVTTIIREGALTRARETLRLARRAEELEADG